MSSTSQQNQQPVRRPGEQHISITIDAPVEVVWAVFTDVERWPTWTASGTTTVAKQSIVQGGPLGRVVGRLYRSLTTRYLTLEAEGLKRRSEQLARAAAGLPPLPSDTCTGA